MQKDSIRWLMVPFYGYRGYFIIQEGGASVIERRIEEEMSRCFCVLLLCPDASARHQGAVLGCAAVLLLSPALSPDVGV